MDQCHFIPDPEGDFDGFQSVFAAAVAAHLGAVLSPAQLAEVVSRQAEWESAYAAHGPALAAARVATQRKLVARVAYRDVMRQINRIVQIDPSVSDAIRVALGLHVRDKINTRNPAPASFPRFACQEASAQAIFLRISDSETGARRKPKGTHGCEIYVKLGGDPPRSVEECRFLGLATDGRFTATFSGSAVGQPAHFLGRWINRRGEPGPRGPGLTVIVPI